MDVYDKIDGILRKQKMSRRKLAISAGIPPTTLQSIFARGHGLTYEKLESIALVLKIPLSELTDNPAPAGNKLNYFWTADLEDKMKQVGFSVGFDEDNANIWINYPDGYLNVNTDDLKDLHESTNDFMRFKLEELKKKKITGFQWAK